MSSWLCTSNLFFKLIYSEIHSFWCIVVMVTFMCQLDDGVPGIWLNIISGCSEKVFLNEINLQIGELNKQFAFLNGTRHHPVL